MTPEEQKEFDELNDYKEFAKLFFNIFELEYLKDYFILDMRPQEPYKINPNELRICLLEEDANKVLKVAELLEQENDIQQDEVEEDE